MPDSSSNVLSHVTGTRLAAPEEPVSGLAGRSPSDFLEAACLPFLRRSQNLDGGWGFRPGCESRVEPTCWALLALLNATPKTCEEHCSRGFQFLHAAQLPDGSWPATTPTAENAAGDRVPEPVTGCPVTALACWALLSEENSRGAVAAGLRWLSLDRPRTDSLLRRWLGRLSSASRVYRQNDSLIGWGWTPRTASWVEPTAIALIVLNRSPRELLSADLMHRRQSAEAMLYDRMCPGGGWNSGNPLVYGVAGQPLVMPTSWALLALRQHAQRSENLLSLDWLEKNVAEVRGPGSLALARICMEAYGRQWPAAARFEDLHRSASFLESVPATAWVCLAATSNRRWLLPDFVEAI